MPAIVITNVNQIVAPAPILLQQTGAVLSQGATTLAANASQLLTQPSDLTSILAAPLAISSLTWTSGTVTVVAAIAIPGLVSGDKFITTIAGATPAGYNGLITGTVTGANTFTYPLATNPGAQTVAGTYTRPSQGELLSMVTSYFAQGSNQGVFVLELGPTDGSTGPTALDAYIIANPGVYYSYLIPRSWDGQTTFLALIAKYEAPTAKINFFVTTTINSYQAYTALMTDVFALIEAPGLPLTEFSCAAPFQVSLAYNPSSSNRMTPFANKFLFGVTPYPLKNNTSLLATLYKANINVVGTGAEGGISTAALAGGMMLDGNDFTYWYAADWAQINGQLVLANEVFNGANNSANPLYYDQNGINRLQDRLVKLFKSAVSFGLLNGTTNRAALDGPVFQQNFDDDLYVDQNIVNAVPFITYTEENPGDFKIGKYNGLTAIIIPQRGFNQIIFNLTVSSLIAP